LAEVPLRLTYEVVPPRSGSAPHPVLVLLHGRGADEHDLLGLEPALDPRLLILSARATHPLMGGYAWYDIYGIGEPNQEHLRQSVEAIAAFCTEAVAAHQGDPDRLYALGFSQGAAMVGGLLLTGAAALAGGVMLSGYVPVGAELDERPQDLKGRPVFVGHGTHDGVIPLPFGRATRDFFTAQQADLTYREYPMAHQIGSEELSDAAQWLKVQLERS